MTEYTPQSGSLGTIQEHGVAQFAQEITQFNEQDAGWTSTIGSGEDATMNLSKTSDSDLGNFLARPVRIGKFEWSVGQPFFQQFNPWDLFLSDSRVKEKIANYELFRCKLHVKAVISGTQFHYGRVMVSYNPYSGFDNVTVERNFLTTDLIQASQKPHFFLNPTNNTGGQLDLPFFWHRNYLSLNSTDVRDMGEIVMKSFYGLSHANSGNDAVDVTVFAWATDVVLTMPTGMSALPTSYSPQAGEMNGGDEYGKGIISAPASAVARAAGQLKNVPAIAPYARATEMVAKGVGELASHWGYSRPPIVTDIVQQKPFPAGNLTNTDAADAVQKLSLDSKQEITIDSRTVGLDGEDQMDLKRFAMRESYLTSFAMTPTQQTDDMLWNCRVSPALYSTLDEEIHTTPMCYASIPFLWWQGSIKYRFQVVKSGFHKGKILVRWDPKAHNSDVQYNTVYSRVIDLAECDDFEIVVGWGQSAPFLKRAAPGSTVNYSDSSRFLEDTLGRHNGVLEVDVVNSLVSPGPDAPITFNVYVSACDDFKLGEPSNGGMKSYSLFHPTNPQTYSPQSGEMTDVDPGLINGIEDKPTDTNPVEAIADTGQEADQTMNVFFGESPTSIRELCRRYVKVRSDFFEGPTAPNNSTLIGFRDKMTGQWPGYDPNGIDDYNLKKANLVVPTFFQWFMPCYAGWRGGLRAKYTFAGNIDSKPVVTRIGYSSDARVSRSDQTFATGDAITQKLSVGSGQFTAGGSASTNLGINDTIEVEVPYYNATRLTSARLPSADYSNGGHSSQVSFVLNDLEGQDKPLVTGGLVHTWRSVGEDFTLFFYTGTPILYRYELSP